MIKNHVHLHGGGIGHDSCDARRINENGPSSCQDLFLAEAGFSRLLKNSVFGPARGRASGTMSSANSSPARGGRHEARRCRPASRHIQRHFP